MKVYHVGIILDYYHAGSKGLREGCVADCGIVCGMDMKAILQIRIVPTVQWVVIPGRQRNTYSQTHIPRHTHRVATGTEKGRFGNGTGDTKAG